MNCIHVVRNDCLSLRKHNSMLLRHTENLSCFRDCTKEATLVITFDTVRKCIDI